MAGGGAVLSKSAAGRRSTTAKASLQSARVGSLAACASPEATGAPVMPKNIMAARFSSADAASPVGAPPRARAQVLVQEAGSTPGPAVASGDCSMLSPVGKGARTRELHGSPRPEVR